jgi:hypothetical protein
VSAVCFDLQAEIDKHTKPAMTMGGSQKTRADLHRAGRRRRAGLEWLVGNFEAPLK